MDTRVEMDCVDALFCADNIWQCDPLTDNGSIRSLCSLSVSLCNLQFVVARFATLYSILPYNHSVFESSYLCQILCDCFLFC